MAVEPYNIDEEISSLCSTGLRPHTLTGIVLRLLTRHFSTARGIQEPQLQSYIWDDDPKVSKILIAPVWRWLTPNQQQRPAILVKRNALRPRQLALGDGQTLVGEISEDKIPANQEVISQIAMAGSHTVFAVAAAAAQAELLGNEISMRLIQYQQAIQKDFGFNRFRVAEIGALSKVEESDETFAVPITVAYTYVDAWSIWSSAPFLKRLVTKASV